MSTKFFSGFPLLVCLGALLSSCIIKGSDHGSPHGLLAARADAGGSHEKADGSSEEDQAEAQFELKLAEIEHKRSQMQVKADLAEAQFAVQSAQEELRDAQLALDAFEASRKLRMDEAQLELDDSTGSAHDAELELAELQAMYDEEEFAEKTKELVLSRGRRNLAHSQRRLAIAREEMRQLIEVELVGEQRELRWDVQASEVSLMEAELAMDIAKLGAKIDVMQADHDLEEARSKIEANS